MKKLIALEISKYRHQRILPIMIIATAVPIILGIMNYKMNQQVFIKLKESQWVKAWSQIMLLYAPIVFPLIISVFSGLVIRIDRVNGNFKNMLTSNFSRKNIYTAKFVTVMFLVFCIQFIFLSMFFIIGRAAGIQGVFPLVKICGLLFFAMIGSMTLIGIQMYLSLRIESFSVPILIGGFASMMGFFFRLLEGVKYLWPWALPALGMNPTNFNGIEESYMKVLFSVAFIITGVLLCKIGGKTFTKEDIA